MIFFLQKITNFHDSLNVKFGEKTNVKLYIRYRPFLSIRFHISLTSTFPALSFGIIRNEIVSHLSPGQLVENSYWQIKKCMSKYQNSTLITAQLNKIVFSFQLKRNFVAAIRVLVICRYVAVEYGMRQIFFHFVKWNLY